MPMPNQPKPGKDRGHFIVIPDDLWDAARVAADFRGESISAAVRRFLRWYSDPERQDV